MTDLNQDFNYLSNGYKYNEQKPKRSLRKKLFIVVSFVAILAITPSLIFTISEIDLSSSEKIAVNQDKMKDIAINKAPEVYTVIIEEPTNVEKKNETVIINNDSYWKISKRVCGEGKYYLSVQNQNNSKALYEGELVTVNCTF